MTNERAVLYKLSFAELIERFCNFGILVVLVLILKQNFHLSDDHSFSLFGLFAALSYASLVVGGIVADRWLGLRNSVILGGILLVLGNALLISTQLPLFYLGLAVLVLGTGLFKVNCTSLVGVVYEDPKKKESAYTFLYSCMNVGGMLGPLVYGFIAYHWGWLWCFAFNIVMLLWVLYLFYCDKDIKANDTHDVKANTYTMLSTLGMCLIAYFLFSYPRLGGYLMEVMFVLVIVYFISLALRQNGVIRKHIIAILLINVMCVFFFAYSLQVGSSITLFVNRDIPHLYFGWYIPTSAFSSLDPLFVVVAAPFFVWFWKKLSDKKIDTPVAVKIALGVAIVGLAFLALSFSASASTGASDIPSLVWLLVAYVLLGAGEICFIPGVLAVISQYSPEHLRSTLMSTVFLFVALAGFWAGHLSKLTSHAGAHNVIRSSEVYAHAFNGIAIRAFVAVILILCFARLVNGLLKG